MQRLLDILGKILFWLFWIGIFCLMLKNAADKSPDQLCEKHSGSLQCWDYADYQDRYFNERY